MNFILSFLMLLCLSFKAVHGVVINIEEKSKSTDSNSDEITEDDDKVVLKKLTVMDKKISRILATINGDGDTIIYQGCPNGWVSFNASCYLFGSDKLNFVAAQEYCQLRRSHLVSVETTDETAFLKIFMKSIEGEQKGASYWLGLTENATNNSWVWQEGDTKATFFDWASGEPDKGRTEGCVWFEQIKSYQWSDVSCSRTTRPVCEKT
ncbi:perlucin-like isoform X2 [Mercenaria mercenaria]|nr:perlucin-like isoform X2 [Mercenaria mercenaria]